MPTTHVPSGTSSGESSGSESGTDMGSSTLDDTSTSPSSTDATTTSATTTAATTAADSTSSSSSSDEGTEVLCGDGMVGGDEVCDDGINDGSYGGCTADCSDFAPHCGDALVNGPEPCDDGDPDNGDGCNVDCVESGTVRWTRTYAGAAGLVDQGADVDVDADDSIVVGGFTEVVANEAEVLLLRYAVDGSLLFDEQHDLGDDSRALGVAVGPDGNIAIAGDLAETAFLTAMFDADGLLEWSDDVPAVGGGDIGGQTVDFDDGGDVYAAGQLYVGGYDVSVRRYSEAGGSVWSDLYDGGLTDDAFGAVVGDDGLFVAGSTAISASDTNGWLRRYDLDGNPVWTREYAGPDAASDQAWGIAFDPAGYLVVVGLSVDDGGAANGWLRKYDLDGAAQWTETIADPSGAGILDVAVDAAGQIAIVGLFDVMAPNPFVAKHGPEGAQLWIDTPFEGAPESGQLWGIAVDSVADVIVCGSQGEDVWVQKYAP